MKYKYATLIASLGWVLSANADNLLFDYQMDVGEVITPTRLKTPISQVPGSVTVITESEIKAQNITSLIDIMRLVPGMYVSETSGNEVKIQYHGTTLSKPRRMQILIDGVSMYRSGFSRIDWNDLPITTSMIKKVEVTRGPNSATYGANSFQAVINIITKQPRDSQGWTYNSYYTSNKNHENVISFGSKLDERNYYNYTVHHRQLNGFDYSNINLLNVRDASQKTGFNFSFTSELTDDSEFNLNFARTNGNNEIEFVTPDQYGLPDIDYQDTYFSGVLDKNLSDNHKLKISFNRVNTVRRQSFGACLPAMAFSPLVNQLAQINPLLAEALIAGATIDPSVLTTEELQLITNIQIQAFLLAPASLGDMCGLTNQNLEDGHRQVELQMTSTLNNNNRLVYGVSARTTKAKSETFLGGTEKEETYRAFANLESKYYDFVLNIGAMYERDSYEEDLSPKLALNYLVSEKSSLRYVLSKATRTPDIFERKAQWSYSFTDLEPSLFGDSGRLFRTTIGVPGLDSEEIVSKELGWYAQFGRFQWDIKVYQEELTKLISRRLAFSTFQPGNSGTVDNEGAEIELRYKANPNWEATLAYGYNNHESNTPEESLNQSKNNGSLRIVNTNDNLTTALQYLYSNYQHGENYERADLSFHKTLKFDDTDIDLSLTVKHYISVGSEVYVDSRWLINRYEDDTEYLLKASVYF